MAKDKTCDWWKMKTDWGEVLLGFESKSIGEALLAAFRYQQYGEALETEDRDIKVAYNIFKNSIDTAIQDYQTAVENGKKGQEVRKQKRQNPKKESEYTGDQNHNDGIDADDTDSLPQDDLSLEKILKNTEGYSEEELAERVRKYMNNRKEISK